MLIPLTLHRIYFEPLGINSVRFEATCIVLGEYVINTYPRNAVILILRQR